MTLYNSAVQLRLIAMPEPHDELLGPDHQVFRPWAVWSVQVNDSGSWVTLSPVSGNLTVLGTNSTGSYIVRSIEERSAQYNGTLRLVYHALPGARLNYDLQFDPGVTGDYRFRFSLGNPTQIFNLSNYSRNVQVSFGTKSYAFDWSDIPRSISTVADIDGDGFHLQVDAGRVRAGSRISIDPGYVGTSNSQMSTAYTFQRRVFYDPIGAMYWAFYFDGYQIRYKFSSNGVNWLPSGGGYYMPSGWPPWIRPANSMPSLYYTNGQVIVASGYENTTVYPAVSGGSNIGVMEASVYYSIGTISGSQITWSPLAAVQRAEPGCTSWAGSCMDTAGTRLVSVTADSSGRPIFSFNWYLTETPYNNPYTQCSFYYETYLIAAVRTGQTELAGSPGPVGGCYDYTQDQVASVITASDSKGACGWSIKIRATVSISSIIGCFVRK